MQLNLRDIIHTPGASRPFVFQLDLSELEFHGAQPLDRPVPVSGSVRNMAGALVLQGQAEADLALTCDRCLKSFRRTVSFPVDTLLAETLEDEENDEILLLKDGALDLADVFTTAVVLGMDSKHLCSEECKGLCPRCGTDLNGGPCTCKAETDPRLAALAQLLDKRD